MNITKNNMANKKILLGLTTITAGEWKNKVREIDELELKEIALFATCLGIEQRKELYDMLERTKLENIPHIHLRHDMESWELDYLVERFKTQVFNLHARKEVIDFIKQNEKYQDRIFVENTQLMNADFIDVLKNCAGVCLDLAHWESFGFLKKEKGYEILPELLKKYKIGCNHIAAVKREQVHYHDKISGQDFYDYSDHNLNELSELDYVKKYKDYLADIISIELENPLKRQLEVREYLIKILNL